MCGIAGVVNGPYNKQKLEEQLTQVNAQLIHRGPDDAGMWLSSDGCTGFAHRRLSIIELTEKAHQPYRKEGKSFVLVFNGEIYNFKELKEELEDLGCDIDANSDTEVLYAALITWGVSALPKLDGMFAFAFYDEVKKELLLARDNFGEKPLYYCSIGKGIAFASELTALIRLDGFDNTINENSVAQYLFLQYVDAPSTIFTNAKKLEPGTFLVVKDGTIVEKSTYYEFSPEENLINRDIETLADELEEILLDSIRKRLIADVPIGAFLSGGVDSALVVALIRKKLKLPLKTFSIGFSDTDATEHQFAREIAEFLGCEHHEKILSPKELEIATDIMNALDEPNADTSCLPYYLLSQFASKHIKVAITGDGADELFAGYSRFSETVALNKSGIPVKIGQSYYDSHLCVWPEDDITSSIKGRVFQFQRVKDELYAEVDKPEGTILNKLRCTDLKHYLPGSVLSKVDRMSMQFGLEVRTPFLNKAIAEFAQKLSEQELLETTSGKRVLKVLAKRYLPAEWIDRKKMGFSVPYDKAWENKLRENIKSFSSQSQISYDTWFVKGSINKLVDKQNLFQLWSAFVLLNYLKRYGKGYKQIPIEYSDWLAANGIEVSEKKSEKLAESLPLIYDSELKCLVPFNKQEAFDDLKQHVFSRQISKRQKGGTLTLAPTPLFNRHTPKRTWQLFKEIIFYAKDIINNQLHFSMIEKLINADNGLIDSDTPIKHVVFLMHDLASAGAERQLCLNAIAAKNIGCEVSVVILRRLVDKNIHYVSLLKEHDIAVSTCFYPNLNLDECKINRALNRNSIDILVGLPLPIQRQVWNLITMLSRMNADALHCFVDESCIVGGLAALLFDIRKVVFSFRNKNPTHFSYSQPWLKPYYNKLIKSKRIILTGNSIAGNNDYADWLKVPRSKILLIRNAINKRDYSFITDIERIEARQALSLSIDVKCISGIFQLEKYKRPHTFLKVISQIKQRFGGNFKVLVAGDGQLQLSFLTTIKKLALEEQVIYLGRVKNVRRILAASDFMLLTSGFGEGTPNVLIEAQASGIPVVSTEAGGGAREAVSDEKSGFILKDDDIDGVVEKVLLLLRDESKLNRMKKEALNFIAENYSTAVLEQQLSQLYLRDVAKVQKHD